MNPTSPQAVYEHARDAMRRNDLAKVFACLDVNDLKRIAENAVALSLGTRIDDADGEVQRICRDHGFPLEPLLRARRQVMESPGYDATMSMRAAMKAGLAAVGNIASFLAALEAYTRRSGGGGSVSSRLFQDETLADVQIDGSRAWGRRIYADGSGDDVGFVLRKAQWYIRLIATRPPSRP